MIDTTEGMAWAAAFPRNREHAAHPALIKK
jgi:hypothetical protein